MSVTGVTSAYFRTPKVRVDESIDMYTKFNKNGSNKSKFPFPDKNFVGISDT